MHPLHCNKTVQDRTRPAARPLCPSFFPSFPIFRAHTAYSSIYACQLSSNDSWLARPCPRVGKGTVKWRRSFPMSLCTAWLPAMRPGGGNPCIGRNRESLKSKKVTMICKRARYPLSSSGRRGRLTALELRMKVGSYARGLLDLRWMSFLCSSLVNEGIFSMLKAWWRVKRSKIRREITLTFTHNMPI